MDANTADRGGNPSKVWRVCPFWKRLSDVTNGSHRNGGIGFFCAQPDKPERSMCQTGGNWTRAQQAEAIGH